MKISAPFFLVAALFASTAALHAETFEGKVTMKITGPRDGPSGATFSVKEGFFRIDPEAVRGMTAAVIFDQAKGEMTILMPAQKMYLTRPLPKSGEMPAPSAAGASGSGAGEIEKTAATEKILGYDCIKYVSKSKDATTEIWATDQLGAFMGMGGGNPMGGRRGAEGAQAQAWEQALAGKNIFPLRVVTTAGGKETFRLEATSVDKQTLPASTFTPPADFQDVGQMMRGMPGGMRPPTGG